MGKPAFAFGLKALWFGLVSFLLGPFTLWFLLTAKMRRRNVLHFSIRRTFIFVAGFLAYNFFLFLAPLHWTLLLTVYVVAAIWTAAQILKPERSTFFKFKTANPNSESDFKAATFPQAFLAVSLAIYPLVYIVALFQNIGDLDTFSIHLPSDVYSNGLLWMLYITPLIMLLGWAATKSSLRLGIRTLIFFYASVVCILAWIMVWERVDVFFAGQTDPYYREALFFSYLPEQTWRTAVKLVFYGCAFILGTGYLLGARRSGVFFKRAFFLGLPSMMLYANMLFVLGDWNHYLGRLREHCFSKHQFGAYRFLAKAQMTRTPSAHIIPRVQERLAELEYQSGNTAKAKALLQDLAIRCRQKPYYAKIGKRAERSLRVMEAPNTQPALQLDLPLIKPATYLDNEWYAFLSAAAFLKPDWTDLDLKKRLLELSNTVQLHLPKLENVPELVSTLRQLQLPVATCFLTSDRLKAALSAGHVPFLSLHGNWVPISGFDPGRDGFYYYAYQASDVKPWFRNQDTDLFYHKVGEAFGSDAEKTKSRANKYSLQKFISRDELEAHLLDIGGVGLVLGDSTIASAQERKAALLLEQGDVYFQNHENYPEAAAAYHRAGTLFPNDHVWSRMVYLKRRYWKANSDPGNYRNLFHEFPPAWMVSLGPDHTKEKEIVNLILAGKLGSYLMLNWNVDPLTDTAAGGGNGEVLDTALSLFQTLRAMDPHEPLYIDSLASLLAMKGDLEGSEKLYAELIGLYPFGSESAAYSLAWIKLRLGKVKELSDLLAQCESYEEEAKYLTMQGAISMRKKRYRNAYHSLSRSLKLDKSIGETHGLLAEYHRNRGDIKNMQVHLNWQRRSI